MAYERYIRKNGKVYGPYLYRSIRDENGNVKNIYMGAAGEKKGFVSRLFQAFLPSTRSGRMAALLLAAFLTAILLSGAGSAVFDRLTVQGQLRDSSNSILSGNYNFSFNIYSGASGGSPLFQQNLTDVYVDENGLYTATLTDISLPFSANYYLGIFVNGDHEMAPRLNITDTGTAFRSNRSEYLGAYTPSYFLNTSTEMQKVFGNLTVSDALLVGANGYAGGGITMYSGGSAAMVGNMSAANFLAATGMTLGGVYRTTWPTSSGGNTTDEIRAAVNGSDSWFTNIGVRTASPDKTLSVNGSVRIGDYANVSGTYNASIVIDKSSQYPQISFYSSGTEKDQILTNMATGDFYIDSTGGIRFRDAIDNGNVKFYFNMTGGTLGIGSAAPKYTLEVNAADKALNVSNFLFANSTAVCIGSDCRTTWPTSSGGNTTDEIRAAVNGSGSWFTTLAVGTQSASENLTLKGNAYVMGYVNVTGAVNATQLCLGGSCKSDWSGIQFTYYFNKTAETYAGNLSMGGHTGYEAADYICDQNFTGTHFCQEYEIIQTITYKDVSALSTWNGYAWYSAGGAKYTGTNPANDCNGWTDNTTAYLGNFWKFSEGSGAMVNCGQAKSLACCMAY